MFTRRHTLKLPKWMTGHGDNPAREEYAQYLCFWLNVGHIVPVFAIARIFNQFTAFLFCAASLSLGQHAKTLVCATWVVELETLGYTAVELATARRNSSRTSGDTHQFTPNVFAMKFFVDCMATEGYSFPLRPWRYPHHVSKIVYAQKLYRCRKSCSPCPTRTFANIP